MPAIVRTESALTLRSYQHEALAAIDAAVTRGTRLHPGQSDCLVLDLTGSTTRHEFVTVPTLFNLTPTELQDATVSEAIAGRRAMAQAREAEGHLVARTVDLFARRALQWIRADATRYVLSLGDAGHLQFLTDDLALWRVVRVDRARQRTILATGLDLPYAQGVAEDQARACGATHLVNRAAPWRQAPATEKQLSALRRWRVPVPPHCTKGEACDLLTAAVGRAS